MTTETGQAPLDINTISRLLPHRYPFLLLDRVLDFDFGEQPTVRAIKNVTINEPFFQGHFPGHPVMPGVLIVEAMAQAAGILVHLAREADPNANEHSKGAIFYLVKVDNARFSKTVVPGDQLVLEVTQTKLKRGMGLYSCQALVDGKRVASADIMCAAGKETGA